MTLYRELAFPRTCDSIVGLVSGKTVWKLIDLLRPKPELLVMEQSAHARLYSLREGILGLKTFFRFGHDRSSLGADIYRVARYFSERKNRDCVGLGGAPNTRLPGVSLARMEVQGQA